MVKKPIKTDYSALTLPQIIKRKVGRKASFLELDSDQKRSVLDYINNHDIKVEVFGRKWYDVLSNAFYATLYTTDEERSWGVKKEDVVFDSFSALYARVKGDVYNDSCFYGYAFSEQEIKDFCLDVSKMNFDSFTTETIDMFTYEGISSLQAEDDSTKAERAKNMVRFVREHVPFKSMTALEKAAEEFAGKFSFWGAREVFFSLAFQQKKGINKQIAIKFFCTHGEWAGITFGDILQFYGREAALQAIEGFEGFYSLNTKRKKIRGFKQILEAFEAGTLTPFGKIGFDPSTYFYYVNTSYLDGQMAVIRHKYLFETIDELAEFTKGDLCGADFSKAPITKEVIAKYKTDSSTAFPISRSYKTYRIKKRYESGNFIVKQQWLAEDDSVVLSKDHSFSRFFDFVHFLKGNLSKADLLMCDNLERIGTLSGLKLDGIMVRSEVAEALGLPIKRIPTGRLSPIGFDEPRKNEIQTIDTFMLDRPENDDYTGRVSYISDIHLLHRFDAYKCKTVEDTNYVIRTIAGTIAEQATDVNVIAGDTASDLGVFKAFVSSLSARRKRGTFFFTLGNHEFWPKEFSGLPLSDIVQKYRTIIQSQSDGKMLLLHNNLYYPSDRQWVEIPEEELASISEKELREKTRQARVIIFGGIGFAGTNDSFNADMGIYRGAVDRATEIAESEKAFFLYEKVTNALHGRSLIVATHMPMRDWGGDVHAKEGVVYINGHSHRNFFYDDGKKRIYADNQVGYTGRRLSIKQVAVDFNYDWFQDYEDGIYEITKQDYENFYRGISEGLAFNREFAKLFLIKREKTYMFLMETKKGSLLILNGGSIRRAGGHPLEYFYENIVKYSLSVKMFLSQYDEYQKTVSKEVKRFGGDGEIHGSIVDIDFYNHLYLNPLDGTVTPYFAYSMVDKYVYDNLPSLLKYKCPKLFANYQKMIDSEKGTTLPAICGSNLPVSGNKYYVDDTSMYRVSRILKGLQFTTKYNIVRLWSDAMVGDPSEERGKLIVSGIIDPDSIPDEEKAPKPVTIREPRPKAIREEKPKPPVLSEEEKIALRNQKYIQMVSEQTAGKIVCTAYRGSTAKADYKCALCGYEWSTRPDHFKDRQLFKCPKCKG